MSVDNFLLSATTTDLNYPEVRPTLDLNFARTKTLDPRITFTRASGGSYVGADGLIKYAGVNEPRFDHDPVTGECKGFLVEEGRTNLFNESIPSINNWSNTANIKTINNSSISPDGSFTAALIEATAKDSQSRIENGGERTPGTTYTQSCFCKAGTVNYCTFGLYDTTSGVVNRQAIFYLVGNGSVTYNTNCVAIIIPYPNGWYRCIMITTISSGSSYAGSSWKIGVCNLPTAYYTSNIGDNVYIWGAQLERGSFPTSYIPTQGSARTRSQDFPKIIGKDFTDFYNPIEGTISITSSTYTDGSSYLNTLTFSDGSIVNLNNTIEIALTSSSLNNNVGRLTIRSNGISQADVNVGGIGLNLQPNKRYKMIASYKKDDFTFSVDGITYFSDTSGDVPLNISELLIGYRLVSGSRLNGTISRLTYFPKRLPNAQLQALTK